LQIWNKLFQKSFLHALCVLFVKTNVAFCVVQCVVDMFLLRRGAVLMRAKRSVSTVKSYAESDNDEFDEKEDEFEDEDEEEQEKEKKPTKKKSKSSTKSLPPSLEDSDKWKVSKDVSFFLFFFFFFFPPFFFADHVWRASSFLEHWSAAPEPVADHSSVSARPRKRGRFRQGFFCFFHFFFFLLFFGRLCRGT
jgi:hypothetical protein